MSHTADYSPLDQPQVLATMFYPRKGWTPLPRGAQDYLIPVGRGISVSARFFPAGNDSPCLLFFHGNGEVACDYDWVAPLYLQAGISLFVADYRGYGRSGGVPTFSSMVRDAHAVVNFFLDNMRLREHRDKLYLMGRSLGTASVLEIAFHYPEHFSGLIVESGSANMLRVLAYHGYPVDQDRRQALSDALAAQVAAITLPVLIIHGDSDLLIPPDEATELHRSIGAKEKRLVIIPGAGHNDIMVTGAQQYFSAIAEFVLGGRRP